MTEEQKATQENRRVSFDLGSCMAMMKEMMGQQGCDCAEMMSQMMGEGGFAEMTSQMMASCCGVQAEPEEKSSAEATRKA